MTVFPMNARSELDLPTNASGGRMVDTKCMFHSACPASQRPALSPTRGSGIGSAGDISIEEAEPEEAEPDGATAVVDPVGCAQAATAIRAVARERCRRVMPTILCT